MDHELFFNNILTPTCDTYTTMYRERRKKGEKKP